MKKLVCTLFVFTMLITSCAKTEIPTAIATPTQIIYSTKTPAPPTSTTQPVVITSTQMVEETPTFLMSTFFESFLQKCKGPGKYASCIYVNDSFALRLIWGNGEEISKKMGTARLYDYAWNQGSTVGIMAHDYAEGKNIDLLTSGTPIYLIYTDGIIVKYVVIEEDRWINTGKWLTFYSSEKDINISTYDLADMYYLGGDDFRKMVLQTCINVDEGVLYVTANRVDEPPIK